MLFFICKIYLFKNLLYSLHFSGQVLRIVQCLFVATCEVSHVHLVSSELSFVSASELVCLSKLHKLRLCNLCHLSVEVMRVVLVETVEV